MIFPYLRGILNFVKAPATWSIFLLNLFMLAYVSEFTYQNTHEVNRIMDDELFMESQGQFYSQFILDNSIIYEKDQITLANLALEKMDSEKFQILGGMAMRDDKFLNEYLTHTFKMDQVILNWWRSELTQLISAQAIHPSYTLGITSSNTDFTNWISYQFVHSGFSHFFGNMMFLIIFGCFLEPVIGSVAFLLSYILSGMVAAGAFLVLSGVTAVPLIGASGSVSGIMAIFCVFFWKQSVRYIYFLFIPKRGYAGYVYLPGWVTFILWLLADLAGYFGTWGYFGGIAHAAHLGGELAGALAGLLVLASRQYLVKNSFKNIPSSHPIGTTIT